MKTLNNNNKETRHLSKFFPLLVLILALVAEGCAPRPTETISPTDLPTLIPLPPSSTPSPTQTLQLLDSDVLYIVVGIPSEGILPIYQQPSLPAEMTGQIPPAGKSIRTTGWERTADGITWLQVVYQESAGWVDLEYLARQFGDLPDELAILAQEAASALKTANYYKLADIVHPGLCLRFSPYPYLRDSDQRFCPDQLAILPGTDSVYTWGQYDGSGEPIELPFDHYHQRFVYDQDFFQPDMVGLNQEISSGNAINNIPDIYPDGMIVEYHFPGFDPQYGGMDWRSLRMVFVQEKGGWFLVALVHGEWTI